jgi:long-chain fatty acid transport protein
VKQLLSRSEESLFDSSPYSNDLDLGVTVPPGVMASFYHELSDQWALLGNFGWQNWSQFGQVEVTLPSSTASLTAKLNYNDTRHGTLDAQYRLSAPWLLSCGVAYDSSMLDDTNRSPALPLGWSWCFGTGVQYDLSKTAQLGLAYEYLYSGNPNLSKSGQLPVAIGGRGNVNGSYSNMSIQFFSANVTWKF